MFLKDKSFVLFLILLVVFLWAGNFIAISFLVKEIEAYTALVLRLTLVSLLLFPALLKLPSLKDFYYLCLTSIVLVPGHFGLLFLSLELTKSVGAISVILQIAIPFSILLSWFIYKDKASGLRIFGLLVSFIGIIALLFDPSLLQSQISFFIALASACCLGLYFILVKKIKEVSSISLIAWISTLGIPMMYCLMLLNNQSITSLIESFSKIEQSITYYAFLYTVLASSILAHSIWAYLVKTQDISFISPFLLLVPMVSIILSAIFLNEILSFSFILLSSIIIAGIFLVFISDRKVMQKDKNENFRQNKKL